MVSGGNDWDGVQQRASAVLDYVLQQKKEGVVQKSLVNVDEALQAQRLVEKEERRQLVRVLFVTEDARLLDIDSPQQQDYLHLAQLFDEVHILLLKPGKDTNKSDNTMRLGRNVWLYRSYGTYDFVRVREAKRAAREKLSFNHIIRPDVIVAAEPFLAGQAAVAIAHMFDIPSEVFIKDAIFSELWQSRSKEHKQKAKAAVNLLKSNDLHVRVADEKTRTLVDKTFSPLSLDVLPQQYNLAAFKQALSEQAEAKRYPQYAFLMVAQGELTADSPLHDVIAATRAILLNPRIGLVILGDGPARQLFREKVVLLGIEKNVVFVFDDSEAVGVYRAADVFIEADTSPASETHIFRAVSAQVPIVAYQTPLRQDLIPDGRASLLATSMVPHALTEHVKTLLNLTTIRTQLRSELVHIASSRLHEDPSAYYKALRQHIEDPLRAAALGGTAAECRGISHATMRVP